MARYILSQAHPWVTPLGRQPWVVDKRLDARKPSLHRAACASPAILRNSSTRSKCAWRGPMLSPLRRRQYDRRGVGEAAAGRVPCKYSCSAVPAALTRGTNNAIIGDRGRAVRQPYPRTPASHLRDRRKHRNRTRARKASRQFVGATIREHRATDGGNAGRYRHRSPEARPARRSTRAH